MRKASSGERSKQDTEAFAQLYEAYFDKIYRYIAMRMRNETEAEDIDPAGLYERCCSRYLLIKSREYPSHPGYTGLHIIRWWIF